MAMTRISPMWNCQHEDGSFERVVEDVEKMYMAGVPFADRPALHGSGFMRCAQTHCAN